MEEGGEHGGGKSSRKKEKRGERERGGIARDRRTTGLLGPVQLAIDGDNFFLLHPLGALTDAPPTIPPRARAPGGRRTLRAACGTVGSEAAVLSHPEQPGRKKDARLRQGVPTKKMEREKKPRATRVDDASRLFRALSEFGFPRKTARRVRHAAAGDHARAAIRRAAETKERQKKRRERQRNAGRCRYFFSSNAAFFSFSGALFARGCRTRSGGAALHALARRPLMTSTHAGQCQAQRACLSSLSLSPLQPRPSSLSSLPSPFGRLLLLLIHSLGASYQASPGAAVSPS